jgi:hypothetical protein
MTEFNVMGAGTAAYQGTYPGGIDPRNTIMGYYIDGNNVNHGFQRLKDGTVTTIDVLGAGTAPGQGTQGENINAFGVIDGQYIDGSNVYHCFFFVPPPVGYGITTLPDAPDAGISSGQGTFAGPINKKEEIAGYYIDGNNVAHGYLRMPVIPQAQRTVVEGYLPVPTENSVRSETAEVTSIHEILWDHDELTFRRPCLAGRLQLSNPCRPTGGDPRASSPTRGFPKERTASSATPALRPILVGLALAMVARLAL